MRKRKSAFICILVFFTIILVVWVLFFWERTNVIVYSTEPSEIARVDFEINSIGSSSYSNSLDPGGRPLSEVRWEYVTGMGYLEDLSELYGFQYPEDLDLQTYSYIVSFGCKIFECWSEEKIGDDYILTVTYEDNYQGKQVFFYQLPKSRLYPLRWPSYVLKNGERLPFATDPYSYDKTLLEGYEMVEVPCLELMLDGVGK